MDEMTKALQAEDARQAKLHELLETIREQIRLEVLPEHRPKGLFQNIQDAVYAMRGRTPLMHDAVITSRLAAPPPSTQKVRDAAKDVIKVWQDVPYGVDFGSVMETALSKLEAALYANPGEQE
jgi:hypothetical protein